MTSLAQSLSAQPDPWSPIPPAEAGFASNLDARLDQAIADKRVWNLHGLVVLRDGRLVLERYFEGEDRARGIGEIGRVRGHSVGCLLNNAKAVRIRNIRQDGRRATMVMSLATVHPPVAASDRPHFSPRPPRQARSWIRLAVLTH
jgi:hypothetical protein